MRVDVVIKMFYKILFLVNCFNYFSVSANVYPCVTPDREKAYCTSLFSCPHLMKTIGSLEPSAIEYAKKSICLGCKAGELMVCCGSPPPKPTPIALVHTSATSIPITTTTGKYSSDFYVDGDLSARYKEAIRQRLLPDERYCGFQHTDDRLGEKPTTALDEFPWLAHISGTLTGICGGVLINNRYVLTDSYCGLEALRVKLGEYHTNQTVSCDSSSKIGECNEPVVLIKVEEIIRDGKESNGPYDFALLRLAQTVEYSDFIRPICLPIDQSKRPNPQSLVFSGWGAPDSRAAPKKILTYDIVSDEVCYNFGEGPFVRENVNFANVSFICVAPPENATTLACYDEHGGPFMYSLTRRVQWYVEGVVIDVMDNKYNIYDIDYKNNYLCNSKHPVNGIRITENTIDWILSTIRP